MFESIKSIKPYFHSLREIENTISLDIKMPLTWKFEEITKQYQTIGVKLQDKNNNHTLISIVSKSDQEGYDIVFTCALDIINVNKEEEEKRELFQRKQKKLQEEYHLKIITDNTLFRFNKELEKCHEEDKKVIITKIIKQYRMTTQENQKSGVVKLMLID